MLLYREYDDETESFYERWIELGSIRLYDIDIMLIVEGALEYMVDGSVWCFKQLSNKGNSKRQIAEALNQMGGEVYLFNARTKTDKKFILTREKLVKGIDMRINLGDMKWEDLIHIKKDGVWRLSSAGYMPKLCDEIVQLALFNRIRYS